MPGQILVDQECFVCTKCQNKLPTEQLSSSFDRTGWVVCKTCYNLYMNSYRHRNKEKVKAYHERSRLKVVYGMTPEQYADMLFLQRGVCAICKRTCQTDKALSVDHDHSTGKVRGLLCHNCNRAVGLMQDDPALFVAAAAYLGGESDTRT